MERTYQRLPERLPRSKRRGKDVNKVMQMTVETNDGMC